MSAQTPRRFWKCSDCRENGEVFDDLGEHDRAKLGALEDALEDQLGAAHDPIQRHP
jgi:hypothetical protein